MSEDILKLMMTSYPQANRTEDNKGRVPLHFAVGGTLKSNSFTISMFELLCNDGAASHADEKGKLLSLRLSKMTYISLLNWSRLN